MIYKKFGHTGDPLSVIGFGASPLGNVFGSISSEFDRGLVAAAIESGINFFDVSPYYGLGLAEERLGAALQPDRDQCFLATKCGRYGVDDFDFSAAGVTRRFEDSLRRLRTDHVDLLQIHDIEFGDLNQVVGETLPALTVLKEQGKTRFIGITGYWPGLLAETLERHPTDSVLNYCHWNLLADDMDIRLTPTCERLGAALINASPLHMGLLSGGPIAEWHPAPAIVREKASEIVKLCVRNDVDHGTLAVWKCLQHPRVTSTLVGMANVEQVKSACAAVALQPPTGLLSEVEVIMHGALNIWWPQGRAENQECSFNEGIGR